MSNKIAVLICGYNDIYAIKNILNNKYIRALERIHLSIDGPKLNQHQDIIKNNTIKDFIESHELRTKITVRYLDKNVGIRFAIPSAVDWVFESYDKIIVLEDDVLPGPNLFPFMHYYLTRYEKEEEIGAISGYTQIPKFELGSSRPQIARLSVFPESYVWGTWRNRWGHYEDNLEMLKIYRSVDNIRFKTNSRISAFSWRLNFINAQNQYLDSWAYRWVASLWEVDKKIIVPNINLIEYRGTKDRTHTRLKNKWKEIPMTIEKVDLNSKYLIHDTSADNYASKHFFHGSIKGLTELVAISIVYRILKFLKNIICK